MTDPEWRSLNRANWDERVAICVKSRTDRFQAHDTVRWPMFDCPVPDGTGAYRWPDKPWLPLSYSLRASKSA